MSYEVLAQKWRPQNFSDVVGQEHVTTTLKNQILSERVGHAYLFWGPRGTGKTTVARIFAKAVNCPNRVHETQFDTLQTAEPCNQCAFCSEISQDRSLDVLEMDAASNRGIDTIRDLRENVKLSPAACAYKIYIIDEAHMLSPEAFNALLKTLEEPPPHVIFIMATTEHAKIPRTISSRCQDFDFRHLEDEKIIGRLQLIAKAEDISADLDVLTLITRQSEGCLRDAENLLELVSSAGKNLTIDTVEQIIGLGSSALLRNLTTAITERDLSKSLKTLNDLAKQGTDLSQCLDQLIGYFRDLRLLAIDDNLSDLIQSPQSDLSELKQEAEKMSVNRLSRIIKILMHTDRDIKEYSYPQIQLEAALIQLNSLEEGIPLQEIVSKLSDLEQKFDTAQISAPQQVDPNPPDRQATSPPLPRQTHQESAKDVETAPVDVNGSNKQGSQELADLPLFWETVKSKITTKLRYLLEGSVPTVNGSNTVQIGCSATHLPIFTEEDRKSIVNILTQEIGTPVKIELVALETTPESAASQNASEKTERKTSMIRKAEAQDDPQLKTALDLFEATVLETQ